MENLKKDLRTVFSWGDALRRRPWILCVLLLLYGMFVAYYLVNRWNYIPEDLLSNIDSVYMEVRLDDLELFINQILEQGKIILNSIPDHNPSYFWYTAVIGVLTNKLEAWQVFLFVQMIAAAGAIALYPLTTYRWMNSVACALLSPWLVGVFVGKFLYEVKTDTYWSLVWIVVISLPLLGIFWKEKQGGVKWASFALLLLCMGIANSPRSHAALPILLILIVTVVWQTKVETDGPNRFTARENRLLWGRCVLLLAGLWLGYRFFTDIIPAIYALFTHQETMGSWGPWHNVIVGLGWEENPFGFYYSDTSALEVAKSVDPDVLYGSREYAEILQQEFFRLWREEPLYMLETYTRKGIACINMCIFYFRSGYMGFDGFKWAAGILVATGLFRYGKGETHIYYSVAPALLFLGICAVVMLAHPMIMTPQFGAYIYGCVTSVNLLLLPLVLALIRRFLDMLKFFAASPKKITPEI